MDERQACRWAPGVSHVLHACDAGDGHGYGCRARSCIRQRKGPGRGYGGLLELEFEGTWLVTLTVRRAGAAIATKMLLVDATEGMG